MLTVRRAVLCLLWNYACVCLLWQLLDLLSYAPPEKRHALTAGAVTFLAVMIFLFTGLDQLTPCQGADDAVRTQTGKARRLTAEQFKLILIIQKIACARTQQHTDGNIAPFA